MPSFPSAKKVRGSDLSGRAASEAVPCLSQCVAPNGGFHFDLLDLRRLLWTTGSQFAGVLPRVSSA
jgi:hypothetical protein